MIYFNPITVRGRLSVTVDLEQEKKRIFNVEGIDFDLICRACLDLWKMSAWLLCLDCLSSM